MADARSDVLTIRVPRDVSRKLAREARKRRQSRSAVARTLLIEALEGAPSHDPDTHGSITVCPITSDCLDAPLFRLNLPPGKRTGLDLPSQIMVDKVVGVPRTAVGRTVGQCDVGELDAIGEALRDWLSL